MECAHHLTSTHPLWLCLHCQLPLDWTYPPATIAAGAANVGHVIFSDTGMVVTLVLWALHISVPATQFWCCGGEGGSCSDCTPSTYETCGSC